MQAVSLRLFLLLCVLLPLPAYAGSAVDAPHVRVELLARDQALRPDHDMRLGLRFALEKGWHIYWQNPGDSGEPPRVRWTLPAGADKQLQVGALLWPTPHRLVAGPIGNYGYEGEVLLLTTVHAGSEVGKLGRDSVPLLAEVSWLVCNESCIPGKAQLTLTLPIRTTGQDEPLPAKLAARFAAAEAALPMMPPPSWKLAGKLTDSHFQLSVDLGTEPKPARAQFLPLDAAQIDNAAEQQLAATGSTLTLRVQRSEQLARDKEQDLKSLHGLLVLDPEQVSVRSLEVVIPIAPPPKAPPPPPAPAKQSAPPVPLYLALVFALLGGVLLNLMPCVFPVLSLKALGLVQMSAGDRRVARGHAVAYLAGILVSFWALAGVLIALRYGGQHIGWGFQLQSPRFLVGLSVLLFFLGLNLLGVFELGIGLSQLGQATVGRHGYAGAFATGILATVVATPCSAPFMGTAVGFALSQAAPAALLIFTFLGLGLALPYLLLPWIPGLLRILPRPGAWMQTFKEVMGFLLFLTVLWLAWVLGAQGGADAVVALLCGLLLIGLAGWILHRFGERRAASLLAALIVLGGAVLPGWQLGARFAAPPGSAQPIDSSSSASSASKSSSASTQDLRWEAYSSQKLNEYRLAGKPVLVDFTADWCMTCKVNERLVLRSAPVRARVEELGVVAMKADWTREDEVITQALQEFGRSSVPLYVLYGRDPNARAIELPTVLSTAIVLRALDTLQPPTGTEDPRKDKTQP